MGKKDKTPKPDKVERKLAKLEAIIADKSRPKAERKAAKAQRAELVASLTDGEVMQQALRGAARKLDEGVADTAAPDTAEHDDIVATAPELKPGEATPADVIAAADRVLADKGASEGAIASAKAARKRAERALKLERAKAPAPAADEPAPVDDAAIARRVKAKRLLRKAVGVSGNPLATEHDGVMVVDPDDVPRDNAELVAAYNEVIGTTTGHYLTSDDERAAIAERIKGNEVRPAVEGGGPTPPLSEPKPDDEREAPGEAIAAVVAAVEAELEAIIAEPETIAEHEAVEVETETGTVYAVGPAVESSEGEQADPGFASPSDAGPVLEEGRNGYKIAMLNAAGEVERMKDGRPKTVRQFTRVTTYIDNLDDTTNLAKWKQRILIEGLVANETAVATHDSDRDDVVPPHLLAAARDAIHVREVAIAKARKADRKGKLVPGDLGDLVDEANATCKRALDDLAEQALKLGGVKAAADKGTNLHALTEVYDEHGIEPIAKMLAEGTITPADFADLEAYGAAMKRAGIKVIERETVVVDDTLKVAGRLDKIVLGRASADAKRATRMVADVKTGRVDYAPGKIAQQLALYAGAKRYDLETFERSDHGASRTTALLIHLPAGKATCHVYAVDLVTGRVGNRISGEVRAWRSSSKAKAIDFTVDLAAPVERVEGGDES